MPTCSTQCGTANWTKLQVAKCTAVTTNRPRLQTAASERENSSLVGLQDSDSFKSAVTQPLRCGRPHTLKPLPLSLFRLTPLPFRGVPLRRTSNVQCNKLSVNKFLFAVDRILIWPINDKRLTNEQVRAINRQSVAAANRYQDKNIFHSTSCPFGTYYSECTVHNQ